LAAGKSPQGIILYEGTLVTDGATWKATDIPVQGDVDDLSPVTLSADGKVLALGTPAGVQLWDLRDLTAKPKILCTSHHILSVALGGLSREGRYIACGSRAGKIQIWKLDPRLSRPKKLKTLCEDREQCKQGVVALGFSPREDQLASASSDHTVRLWYKQQGWTSQPIELKGHTGRVWTLAFAPDGDRVISGSEDGTVRIWMTRTELLAEAICGRVSRTLTPEEWANYLPRDMPYSYQQPSPCS
jgi:WD40 repeat protein